MPISASACWVLPVLSRADGDNILPLPHSLLPDRPHHSYSHLIVSLGAAQTVGALPNTWCSGTASLCPFLQVSVLTGIIKISLKTLLECVRLRTFGRFGLQQVQVDCHFLQLYLWRFVADEELVHLLLDEVVASAALRCPDPVPMEPSVVEVICERG